MASRPWASPLARRFALAAVVALTALAGSLAIPHDRYIRWQEMRSEAWARLGWIYERVHFDRTPIDIAFIGTSHSMNGIDGAAVQAALTAAGGGCRNVVNFAYPSYGRNLHWLIARELLERREVRTLVIEVLENESRKAHPFFINVAEVSDVLEAPLLINLNFFTDIMQLPARQVMLGLKTLLPERFGLRRRLEPAHYDGPDVDNTRHVQVGGTTLTPLRDRVLPPGQLEAAAAKARSAKNTNMLGEHFEALEYRYPRHYLDRILQVAKQRGVTVKFLYLPSYAYVLGEPRDSSLYVGRGEMLTTGKLLADTSYWYDPDHLNLQGAAVLSAELGRLLAEGTTTKAGQATTAQAKEPAPCAAAAPDVVAAHSR